MIWNSGDFTGAFDFLSHLDLVVQTIQVVVVVSIAATLYPSLFTASPVFSIVVYYFLVVTVYNLLGLNLLGLKLRCTLYFCISKIRMPLKMSVHLDIHDNMSKFNEVPVFPDLERGVAPFRPSCTHTATAPWRWGCSSQWPPLTSGVG